MAEPSQSSTEWDEANDEFIRQNYRVMSARKIGEALGFSKNSVISRAHRIGMGKPYAEVFPGTPARKRKRKVERRAPPQENKLKALPIIKVKLPEDIRFLNGFGVKIWDLDEKMCRWVVGEPSNLTFCGMKKQDGSSYCCDHHKWTVNKK